MSLWKTYVRDISMEKVCVPLCVGDLVVWAPLFPLNLQDEILLFADLLLSVLCFRSGSDCRLWWCNSWG